MNVVFILGILTIIVGVILLGLGINSTQALSERIIEKVSGRYTKNTMWYIIGGISLIVVGFAIIFISKYSSPSL